MKIVYVVEFHIEYEGFNILKIFSSLESAIKYTEQQVEQYNLGKTSTNRMLIRVKDNDATTTTPTTYIWECYDDCEFLKITEYELELKDH